MPRLRNIQCARMSLMEIKKKKRMRLKFKMLKDTLTHHPFYLKGLQGANLKS